MRLFKAFGVELQKVELRKVFPVETGSVGFGFAILGSVDKIAQVMQ